MWIFRVSLRNDHSPRPSFPVQWFYPPTGRIRLSVKEKSLVTCVTCVRSNILLPEVTYTVYMHSSPCSYQQVILACWERNPQDRTSFEHLSSILDVRKNRVQLLHLGRHEGLVSRYCIPLVVCCLSRVLIVALMTIKLV